jgi:uncharacterized protein
MQRRTFISLFAVGLLAATGPALAQSAAKAKVDAAKAEGVVGEQADGFLVVIKGNDAALKAAVDEINGGRRKVYEEAAQKAGTSIEAAGQAAGKTILERLPKGYMHRPIGGAWTAKQ